MSNNPTGISRAEAAAIRAKLVLRFNAVADRWEVYTTIHGTGVFRWYAITNDIFNWYRRNFPSIKIEDELIYVTKEGGISAAMDNGAN